MAKHTPIEFSKTYATEANAHKAVQKVSPADNFELRYAVMPVVVDGAIRYGVLFIGQSAVTAGMHWHFNVVA